MVKCRSECPKGKSILCCYNCPDRETCNEVCNENPSICNEQTTIVKAFSYEGNEVRTVQRNGETWWVLKDVCNLLNLTTPARVAERLDNDEVSLTHIIDSIGRKQETTIINESGLYSVIIRSDKPEAKKFRRWVTHEVLPSIRKHGAYITTEKLEEIMSDPNSWITLLTTLMKERETNKRLRLQIEADKPKVLFANAVSESDDTILIGELAKILRGSGIDTGPKRLFKWMRREGYLVKRYGSEDFNTPTQKAMDMGLFKVKETALTHLDGHVTISKTTKVTGKGQLYFISMFLGEQGNRLMPKSS